METNASLLAHKATILVVDDTPDNLSLMQGLLKDKYKVKGANNGERGLKIACSDTPPDLILLDVMMPGIDGYEVCRRLKAEPATRDIPVIFLTAKSEVDDEMRGLELGAVDYITKPISPPIVLARVHAQLSLKASADFLRDKNVYLEAEVVRRTREVAAIQDVTIMAMASLAETRDSDTGNHIRRTQHYVKALATKLATHPRFAALLGESPKSMLDVLAFAEKMQWIENAEIFIGARKLRNLLVHEYMSDAELFLQALITAREAANMLFDAVNAIEAEAVAVGVVKANSPLDPVQKA